MVTKMIGVKEFRQNLASYHKKAIKNGWNILVMNHNQAIFEIKPLTKKEATLKKLAVEIAEARQQARDGKVYTVQEIRRKLGI